MLGLRKTGCTDSAGLTQIQVAMGHAHPELLSALCKAEAYRGVLLTLGTPTTGASTPACYGASTRPSPGDQKNMVEMFDLERKETKN